MSGLPEVRGHRSGSHDSHVVSSGFQDDQIDDPGQSDRQLSEKVAQFLKVVKDIDDVLDTWVGSSPSEVFVKLSSREILCLQNLESSAVDAIILDIYNRTLSSFSSYISEPDSVLRTRLLVSMKPRQMQRPLRGVSANDQCQRPLRGVSANDQCQRSRRGVSDNDQCQRSPPVFAHFLTPATTDDDENVSALNQALTFNTTNSNIHLEVKGKPPSVFGLKFMKWRRRSESTLSTGQTRRQRASGIPACSSNIMNYTQRRNSDTGSTGRELSKGLNGHELSKLRRVENMRDQSAPNESTSEIAQLFGKLMRKVSNPDGLKRNSWSDTCSLTDGSYKDDCSTSGSSINVGNLKEFSEADTESGGSNARDYTTMYSSAPNISSIDIVKTDSSFNSECDIASNVKVGQPQSGIFRSGSLKVLNFFRHILPDEKPCTSQPLSFPRRLSMDSQLTCNRIPTFERDNIKPGQRIIKINRPDHSRAMYISAADTLGGLPEHEEMIFPHRLLRTQFNCQDEGINDYLTTGRRASCPVILETEETDECVSSSRFRLLSAKSKATDPLSENSDTGDSDETVHSLDESANRPSACYKTILASGKSQYISDNATSSGSRSEAEQFRAPSLLEGVTFIVDKRPRFKERQPALDTSGESKHRSSDVSSDDRGRPNNTSSADRSSSNDELHRRPNKMLKKKRKKNTKYARNTHSAGVGDAHAITTSNTQNLSSSRIVTVKTSSGLCEQSNNNELQVKITLNENNNNSLDWNDSSTSLSSLVREIGSSSYFSDISSADN